MAQKKQRIKPLAKSAEGKKQEAELLVEFALGQKKVFLQHLLKEKGLHFSGTKELLRDRVLGYLEDGQLTGEELANFLDSVEGWGNQTIYLSKVPALVLNQWRNDQEVLKKKVREAGFGKLINLKKPMLLPEIATLSLIEITEDIVRFICIEKHEWYQRTQDLDKDNSTDIIFRAYRRNLERRITRFEIDLRTGDCLLAIPKISSLQQTTESNDGGQNLGKYEVLKAEFEEVLEPILTISSFKKINLHKAIARLQESDEVRRRENVYETPEGSKIKLLSSDSETDTRDDVTVESLRGKIPDDTPGTAGSYKWLPDGQSLQRELIVKLFGMEKRIAIGVQCTEAEVKYVLSRIRILSQ